MQENYFTSALCAALSRFACRGQMRGNEISATMSASRTYETPAFVAICNHRLLRRREPARYQRVDVVTDAGRLTAQNAEWPLCIAKCFSLVSEAGCCLASAALQKRSETKSKTFSYSEVGQ